MRHRKRIVRLIVVMALACCLLLSTTPHVNAQSSQPVDKSELAKNLIVKITGDNVSGSGIVFGQLRDMLFIATANHVVRRGTKEAQNLRVAFNFWFEEIEVKLLGKFDKDLDLAVLLVKLEESDLSSDALSEFLPLTQLHYVPDVQAGSKVYPVGHPPGKDWFTPISPPQIYEVERENIRFDFQCDQGYSGGGIFNENWGLVGMVTRFNPPLCEAVSFDRIQEILKKWRFVVSLKPATSPLPALALTPTPLPTAMPTPLPTATPPPLLTQVPRQEKYDPVSGINFVWVPAGCFRMGSPDSDQGRDSDEAPVHEVCVDGFWMGKYEVTQTQWEKVMGKNPSFFKGDSRPVEQVSWNDVQRFLKTLNGKVDKEMYRLPTEAEWEYAVRAGTDTMFYFGNDAGKLGDYAWYAGNSGAKAHLVGQLKPNAWGLYDMHGNVWEWCQDWYDSEYYWKSPSKNPKGPSSRDFRVLRGGSWYSDPNDCRSANRYRNLPDYWYDANIGFRVVVGSGAWTFQ